MRWSNLHYFKNQICNMKTSILTFTALVFLSTGLLAQGSPGIDSTGLPGDQFSLQGALQLFKEAASPEAFETALNNENNHVNNLDLNEDGDIDYIRIEDKMEGDVHVFILQATLGDKDVQDIATIEIEKTGKEEAMLQIIGDEDIYGEEVIVEPTEQLEEKTSGRGPSVEVDDNLAVFVNVWVWPSVRFVYAPVYRPWVSPFRWRVYPAGWRPWRPLGWRVFHPFHVGFHRHYAVVHTHRTIHARAVYRPHRTTSVTVKTRHSAKVGNYRVTRTKTTHTGPRGNTTTRKTTTVKKNGKMQGRSTTVRKGKN